MRKFHRTLAFSLTVCAVLAGGFGMGCGGEEEAPAAGPIDGTWLVTSLTCNGVSQNLGTVTTQIVIANTSGTTTDADSASGCTITTAEGLAYPASGTLLLTNGNQTCSSACSSGCGGPSNDGTKTFVYVVTGTTMTFTRTADGTGQDCPNGEEIIFTFAKQ
jgi:hypothetical protein